MILESGGNYENLDLEFSSISTSCLMEYKKHHMSITKTATTYLHVGNYAGQEMEEEYVKEIDKIENTGEGKYIPISNFQSLLGTRVNRVHFPNPLHERVFKYHANA